MTADSPAGRPRVVFDCNVLLQAAARPGGTAAACLRLLDANRISVYVSPATVNELREVFACPSVRKLLTGGPSSSGYARGTQRVLWVVVPAASLARSPRHPSPLRPIPPISPYNPTAPRIPQRPV